MSDIQLYLLEVNKRRDDAAATARKTASRLENKEETIIQLITTLGEYLNNEDATTRSNTLSYLADVLEALPTSVLTGQQRELLNDFVLSRIENGAEGLGSCARALLALQRLGKFDGDRVKAIINRLFESASPLVQCKIQRDRFEVISLVDSLLKHHRQVLDEMHTEDSTFLPRFIGFFDQEKDPRNLMMVFSILEVPMVEWDVKGHAQELFQAVFDYFPITFRPPPDDPYGITAQDLKDRLRDCLSSTSSFAPHAFPALLDKLDSSSINVKRDALQAIASCVSNYGSGTVNLYSITLWDAIKFEILNAEEEDLAEEALTILAKISRQLASSTHDGPLETFLKPLAKECNEHLEDTPTKQSAASGRILFAATSTAPAASNFVVKAVLPQLLAFNKSADSLARRRGLLEVLAKLVEANAMVFGRWRRIVVDDSTTVTQAPGPTIRTEHNALAEFSRSCTIAYSAALTESPVDEVSFKLLALRGIRALAIVRSLLPDSEFIPLLQTLNNLILHSESHGKDEVKASSIDTLVEIAHQKPQLVIENSLPAFTAQLPDNDLEHQGHYVPALEALAKLTAEQQIFSTITLRLRNKTFAALRQGASADYVLSLILALLWAFSNGSVKPEDPTIFGTLYSDIVQPLVKDIATVAATGTETSSALRDVRIQAAAGRICNLIMRPQPWVAQTEICRNVYTLFHTENASAVAPFDASHRSCETTMVFSTQLLASLQREATPCDDLKDLLRALIYTTPENSRSTQTYTQQISLIINKYMSPSDGQFLEAQLNDILDPANISSTKIRISFAILKALVLRNDPLVPQTLPSFSALLQNPTLGLGAARLLASTLAPDELLVKENHCTIRNLHKQRFFGLVVPMLIEKFQTVASASQSDSSGAENDAWSTKRNILVALSGTIQHVPFSLLSGDLTRLMPMLLQSVALEEVDVQAAAIHTLSNVVYQEPKLLEQHISGLISRLLDVSTSAGERTANQKKLAAGKSKTSVSISTPKVRVAALSCLGCFVGNLRRELLLPYQRGVVRRLANALDDDRRAVRAEAVRCRATWQGLEGDDDDDD